MGGWMNRWVDEWMDGYMDEWMEGEEWMETQITDGQVYGWMDG